MEGGNAGRNNLDSVGLIDFSIENDLLVTSTSDDAFEGFRLSVNWENRNEQHRLERFKIKNQQKQENAGLAQKKHEHKPAESMKQVKWEDRNEHHGIEQKVENPGGTRVQTKHEPTDSMKQGRRESKSSTTCYRKSLCWDKAFLTNEGILDNEELLILNKRHGKDDETDSVPGIPKDVPRSMGSDSLLDSGRLSHSSLEIDLFADIRASIQKSSKAFYMGILGIESQPGSRQGTHHSSKKMDVIPQNMMKPPVCRRQSLAMRVSGKTQREASVHTPEEQNVIGVGGLSSTNSTSILGQAKPRLEAATKRASLGGNHVKMQNKAAGALNVKGSKVSKRSTLGGPINVFPGFAKPPKSSSSIASPSSSESTLSTSSDSKSDSVSSVKSFSSFLRKKSGMVNPRVASPSPNLKTPRRHSIEDKTEMGNSSTSSKSPASSIDEFSFGSPSLVSSEPTVEFSDFERMHSQIDTNEVVDLQLTPGHYTHVKKESEEEKSLNQYVPKTNKGMVPTTTDAKRDFQTSGLRKPSPKIGFFDERKSMVPTPNRDLKFHSGHQSASRNSGAVYCHRNGDANGKPQPFKAFTESDNVVPAPQKTGEIHLATPEACHQSGFKRNCTDAPKVVETYSSITNREKFSGTKEVGSQVHARSDPILGSCVRLEEKGSKEPDRNKLGTERKRQLHFTTGNNTSPSEDKVGFLEFDISSSKRDGKENSSNNEDKVDLLGRQVRRLNLSEGKKITQRKEKKDRCQLPSGTPGSKNHLSTLTEGRVHELRTPFTVQDSLCNISEEKAA